MTQYLISFDDGAMTFPEEELPDVAKAAQQVVQEARAAGVWVFGAGLEHQVPSVVATDGTVTDGPYPESKEHLGGFAVVDVPHARGRWSGLPRSPSPATVRKNFRAPARPNCLIEEDHDDAVPGFGDRRQDRLHHPDRDGCHRRP